MSPPSPELVFYHHDMSRCGHGPGPSPAPAVVSIAGLPHEIPARCGAGRDIAYWTCTMRAGIPGGGFIGGQPVRYLDDSVPIVTRP